MPIATSERLTREELLARAADTAAAATDVARGIESLRLTIQAAITPTEQPHETKPEIEEGWYEIELMGHGVRTGYLRCVGFGGRQLVEITEPAHPAEPPKHSGDDDPKMNPDRVEWYSPTAVFSLSRTTEHEAIKTLTDRSSDIPF